MIDPEAALEVVSEWLPDFLAWADNPAHSGARALFERGRDAVWESFRDHYGDDPELSGDSEVAAEVTVTLLGAFAEWVALNREAQGVC